MDSYGTRHRLAISGPVLNRYLRRALAHRQPYAILLRLRLARRNVLRGKLLKLGTPDRSGRNVIAALRP